MFVEIIIFLLFIFSGDSEGLYEQLPVETGHGPDDGSISPTGFIDGAPLSPSDDSDLYASVFNQENGEHLVKPSQIKNRRSLQAGKQSLYFLSQKYYIIDFKI